MVTGAAMTMPSYVCRVLIRLFRHPERSRPKGGVVEGPRLVDASPKQVPPLRLAALGSGRDDGCVQPYAVSHEKLDAAERGIAVDEVNALQSDFQGTVDRREMVRHPGDVKRLLVGAALDVVHRCPGDVVPFLVVALVDLRRLKHVMA